jgi:hypothetical protein
MSIIEKRQPRGQLSENGSGKMQSPPFPPTADSGFLVPPGNQSAIISVIGKPPRCRHKLIPRNLREAI